MGGAEDMIKALSVRALAIPMDGSLDKEKIGVAIASDGTVAKVAVKCSNHDVFILIPAGRKLCRGDPRLAPYPRRTKPAPDLFLAAFDILNKERVEKKQTEIQPVECLVFEGSIIGVEAAREAGMRVVWVSHPLTRNAYRGMEEKVLNGKLGEEGRREDYVKGVAEVRDSLAGFEYEKYGVALVGSEQVLVN